MIIGKFLDPRAPSLPQQVVINTDDIAEILQENEEQSANIQQNTDDIELLKQQVSESGTRVRVDGELVAEWSPDELTDDLQQLRLAQSSDSLAIVGLQSENITNKQNIAKLEAETLKTPILPPANTELVGIGTNNAQVGVNISNGLEIKNSTLGIKEQEQVTLNKTITNQNDTVIETYMSSDGNTWYRKYASGWKECGGSITGEASTSGVQLTFPIEFSQPAKCIQLSDIGSDWNAVACIPKALITGTYDAKAAIRILTVDNAGSYIARRISYYIAGF